MKTFQTLCDICKNHIQRSPSRFHRAKRHFCSNKCRNIGKVGFSLGKASEERKEKIRKALTKAIYLPCANCNKSVYTTVSHSKNIKTRYCSYECYYDFVRNEKHVGDYIKIFLPNHPQSNKQGLIREHRKIASDVIGRPLTQAETIHHINEIRDDNRPENLYLFPTSSDHSKYHEQERIGLCPKITESNLSVIAEEVRNDSHYL